MEQSRCQWCNLKNPLYVKYHDEEWGVPAYDDQTLFEFLILRTISGRPCMGNDFVQKGKFQGSI